MQKEDVKQIALLSDSTYALSIPNRATSNLENDLKVIIRHQIQQKCLSGENCPVPFSLSLDIRQIAREKGVKWRTLERNLDKAIEVLKQTPMNETVSYIAENGDRKTDTLYILDKISKNETQRTIEVKVGVSYTEYVINRLLKNPELQTDPHFFLTASSQYVLPFTQWLNGRIFLSRKNEPNKYPFEITATIEEIKKAVPTSANYTSALYRSRVIEVVIKEINNNEYSQLTILNPNYEEYVLRNGRSISGFFFRVALRERTALNRIPLFYSRGEALPLHDDDLPPWHYIREKIRKMGFGGDNDTAAYKRIDKLQLQARRVWKALLYTYIHLQKKYEQNSYENINAGGYFQTVFSKGELRQSVKELAYEVCRKAPFYADDTVRACAGIKIPQLDFDDAEQLITKQTIENNEFLKNFNDKHGRLPGAIK